MVGRVTRSDVQSLKSSTEGNTHTQHTHTRTHTHTHTGVVSAVYHVSQKRDVNIHGSRMYKGEHPQEFTGQLAERATQTKKMEAEPAKPTCKRDL